MPLPRSQLISLDATPHYHVISRCVRRPFLCGVDHQTGRDFSHRRRWIRDRVFELQQVFAIDVCAYAVMSNHFHAILSVDQAQALDWAPEEVARRWMKLFGGNLLVRTFAAGEPLSETQLAAVDAQIAQYRTRLHDISWFCAVSTSPSPAGPMPRTTSPAGSGRVGSRARRYSTKPP